MKNLLLAVFAICAVGFCFTGCKGKTLSQEQMDKKIESLTQAGKDSLETMLDSACDLKFDNLVTHYRDSILQAEAELER